MCRNLPMYERSCNLWKGKKSTEVIVKTNISDSKIWPDKLKDEIKC